MIIEKILETKKIEIKALNDQFKFIKLQNLAEAFPPARDFKSAVQNKEKMNIIAEIKKGSPSAGEIIKNYEPLLFAKAYEESGASAISVLTDQKFFFGVLAHLKAVKEGTNIPVLRKDFIIDPLQVMESRLAGADAILLIARILDDSMLKTLIDKANEVGLSYILEVHDEKEAERALAAKAEIIGINNRDLDSLKVDIKTSFNLVSKYPELKSKLLISESGISSPSEIKELKSAGFSSVLVGESLLKSPDVAKKFSELLS